MDKPINQHLKQLSAQLSAIFHIAKEANEELSKYCVDLNTPTKCALPKTGTDFVQFLMHYEDKVVNGGMFTRDFLDLYDIK